VISCLHSPAHYWVRTTGWETNPQPWGKQPRAIPLCQWNHNYMISYSPIWNNIRKLIAKEAGELHVDVLTYENPTTVLQPTPPLSQRIRFNLIRHQGTVSDTPTGKLFKSFLTTLWNADSSLIIIPYHAAKQYYSSLANLKQIESIDDTRLLQFFKPYYQKQQYSLSGYFHVSSTLAFEDLRAIPQI